MIGIDIIKIKRFKRLKRRDLKNWNKVFFKDEWDYCFSQPCPAVNLAGLFAAKEAVIKALGRDYLGHFNLVRVSHNGDGAPIIQLKGRVKKKMTVSISHDVDYAVAVAWCI